VAEAEAAVSWTGSSVWRRGPAARGGGKGGRRQIKKAIAREVYPPGEKSGRAGALALAVVVRKMTCRARAAAASESAFRAFRGSRRGLGDWGSIGSDRGLPGWDSCPN
jgi:hypothetical protein